MPKKVDKELKKLNQIAEGVTMIRQARSSMEDLAQKYNNWIDEAAELGEDEYSDQLISDQVELEEFARNLSFFEKRIREGATTAKAFNNLKNLPNAMKACKSLLAQGPDFKQLGKQMSSFKKAMDNSRSSLKDLRSELSATQDPVYAELFGEKLADDPKIATKIAAKKKEREARMAAKISKNVPNPVDNSDPNFNISNDPATDIDAITRMIDDETNKPD